MKFDIDVKDVDTGEDLDISMSNMFRSLSLDYKYNSIPRAKLAFAVTNLNWFTRKNLDVKLIFQTYSTTIHLGIDNLYYTGKNIIIEGPMIHRKYTVPRRSRYLGDTAPKAIKTLGFTHKLKDVENNNIKYWQFNETDANCLEKILLGNKKHSIYYITEDTIGIRDLNKDYNEISDQISLPKDTSPDIVYDNRYQIKDLEVSRTNLQIKSVNEQKYEISMVDSLNRAMICDKDDWTVSNALTNWIPSLDLNLTIVVGYSEWKAFNVGDIVRYEFDALKVKNLIVLEVHKTYIDQNPYTALRLGILKEPEKKEKVN